MIKKETVISILVCVILSVVFAAGIQYSFSAYDYFKTRNVKLYDSKLEKPDSNWLGPKIGEKLDLSKLKDKNGNYLENNRNNNLLMLLVVAPDCIVCNTTTSQMREIENQTKQISVDFAVVSFNPSTQISDLMKFNETAHLASTFYSFDGKDPDLKLQFPAYILVNTDNTILRVFAGSNPDEQTQNEMSKQIIKDTLEEKNL